MTPSNIVTILSVLCLISLARASGESYLPPIDEYVFSNKDSSVGLLRLIIPPAEESQSVRPRRVRFAIEKGLWKGRPLFSFHDRPYAYVSTKEDLMLIKIEEHELRLIMKKSKQAFKVEYCPNHQCLRGNIIVDIWCENDFFISAHIPDKKNYSLQSLTITDKGTIDLLRRLSRPVQYPIPESNKGKERLLDNDSDT